MGISQLIMSRTNSQFYSLKA